MWLLRSHQVLSSCVSFPHHLSCTLLPYFPSNGTLTPDNSPPDIFDLPYPIYTDSSQQLYRALGLHMTEERSIPSHLATHMHATHQGGGARYVKHKSVGAFAMVVRRALKVGMPVWEKGGAASSSALTNHNPDPLLVGLGNGVPNPAFANTILTSACPLFVNILCA